MISEVPCVFGILCIALFISDLAVSRSFPNSKKLETNKTRINHCRNWQFQCNSGQCIAEPFVCDGLKNCKDYSDETYDQCRSKTSIKCKEDQFQCQYGACIENKYQCDGQTHCVDGSDESPDTCNLFRDQHNEKRNRRDVDKSCAVPGSSEDRTIDYICGKNPSSGTCGPVNGYVLEFTIATVVCAPGYYLDNSEIEPTHVCYDSHWLPKIDKCLKKCDKLDPVNVVLECNRNRLNIDDCDGNSVLLAGTKVRPTCKPAYKYDSPPSYYEIKCNDNGKWDGNLHPCVPECGNPYHTDAQPTISGGTPESIGGSPWHVAIFNKDKAFICGGTIISETLVLSAAHCFSDGTTCQVSNCSEKYEIVIGKYTSNYTVKDNSHQKTLKIKEIRFARKGYRGLSTYYVADIAIVILEEKIPISRAILPACLNWEDLKKKKYPSEDEPGKVVGWGRTENDTFSAVLRNLTLPFISYQRCVDMVDTDFRPYVTLDKFCAGTRNRTGPTVLEGDSGGGLLFEEKNLFYLRGIVSVKQIFSNAVAVFTDLSEYVDWIASVRDQVEKNAQNNRTQSVYEYDSANLPIVPQTYDVDNANKQLSEDIILNIQSNNFFSAQLKLEQADDDTYRYIVKKLYNPQTANFELLLRFADFLRDYEKAFKLYDILHPEIRNINQQTAWRLHQLRKSVKHRVLDRRRDYLAAQNLYNVLANEIEETSVEAISLSFQKNGPWAIVRQLSADIHNDCYKCIANIYHKVVETVWKKVTVLELLRNAQNNLINISERMVVHSVIFSKLKQTDTFIPSLAAELAHFMKDEIDMPGYNSVPHNNRTNYEVLYNTVKTAIREATVGPVSAAFQNDTLWPLVNQLSADIYEYCHECSMDIYNEAVETVWNKVTIQHILHKVQNNLNVEQQMTVHKVLLDKLLRTETLTAGSGVSQAAHIKEVMRNMKEIMDTPSYRKMTHKFRSEYETLYEHAKKLHSL